MLQLKLDGVYLAVMSYLFYANGIWAVVSRAHLRWFLSCPFVNMSLQDALLMQYNAWYRYDKSSQFE